MSHVVTGPVATSVAMTTFANAAPNVPIGGELGQSPPVKQRRRKKQLRCVIVHQDYTIVDTIANSLQADYSLMEHEVRLVVKGLETFCEVLMRGHGQVQFAVQRV